MKGREERGREEEGEREGIGRVTPLFLTFL